MITVEKQPFLDAIKSVKTATAKANLQPVLSAIHLKTENGGLTLTCTDCTNIARAVVEANITENFDVCINAEKLDAIVSRLDNTITLEIKDAFCIIKSGKIVFKCLYIQGNEFPNINIDLDGQKILLSKNEFISGVNKTCFATLENNQNNIISGICFTFGEKSYEIVATDGNRLSQVVFNDTAFQGDGQYVIPKVALTSVAKIIKNNDLQIFCKNDNVVFYTDNFVYSTRLLNGKYPEYKQIIPKEYKQQIVIDKSELLKSLETISIMANDRTNIIKLIFKENNLDLTSQSENGEAKDNIEIDYPSNNDELMIAFNYHFLIEGLKAMNSDVITININNNTSAVLFVGDYNYLAMPIQIKE